MRKDIPESPRYLEQKGRFQEADEIVSKMEQQAGISNNKATVVTQRALPYQHIVFIKSTLRA